MVEAHHPTREDGTPTLAEMLLDILQQHAAATAGRGTITTHQIRDALRDRGREVSGRTVRATIEKLSTRGALAYVNAATQYVIAGSPADVPRVSVTT
jgi:repressor of nif and glnA expression